MEYLQSGDSYKRTTQEQLNCYLQFLNDHPEMESNKNDPTNPSRMKDLWKTLADQLNALKGPTRTARKWKESLSHWKAQVRSRARKIKFQKSTTGGGPAEEMNLTPFEEKAVGVFGKVAVDGLPDLNTLGTEECTTMTEIVIEDDISEKDSPENLTPETAPRVMASAPPKKRMSKDEQGLKEVLDYIKKKDERDEKFQEMSMTQQKLLSEAIQHLAECTKSLAKK